LASNKQTGEETMTENKQEPLDVPMDQVITRDGGDDPKESEPKGATTGTRRIEGSHTQETVDPAERLPEEPGEQNDLA
jgi:hypothetical protein